MTIYFRTDGDSLEYSLDEFNKEEACNYSEFDIDDNYSDEEAELLCEKMINEFKNNGISLSDTLKDEINKRNMLIESMKNFDTFKVVNSNVGIIHFSVYLVYKCNFNDDRIIESLDINIDTLKDKEETQKAQQKFIHAAYGFGQIEDDEYFVSSFDELPSLIKKLFSI